MLARVIVMVCAALLPLTASAGRITMSNPEKTKQPNGQTLCVYSNSIYTFTFITKGECPAAKTFDTEDSEG